MSVVERPAAVARLLDEIAALERAYSSGHHGRWSAARRAGFVDACLVELFAASPPRPMNELVRERDALLIALLETIQTTRATLQAGEKNTK